MQNKHTKRPLRKRFRDAIFYYLIQGLIFIIRLLPRKTTFSTMRLLGGLLFLCARTEREKTISHLRLAYGNEKSEQEIQVLAKQVFQHFTSVAVDFICLPRHCARNFQGLIQTEGMEHMEKACADGKGAIFITGHFGNWELLGAWLAHNGFPLKVVGRALDNVRLNKLIVSCRNNAGYENISRGKGTREILRALSSGTSVGMLIDQDADVHGIFVSFFNQAAHTPIGPCVLSRKLGLPIVPIFMHLCKDDTYKIQCLPPIYPVITEDKDADIFNMTQQCSDVYETIIRQHPEQWAWMHKRWKTLPTPSPN